MSQFSINPELSAELLGQINSGIFDRGIFAIPGDAIRPGGGTRPLGERVQPGDVITADLINFILARLDALESRPVPTVPTVPTIPTVTFVPTFTLPTFTTFPTGIFTMPTGPVFTLGPTGPVFTMGPTGPVFTMGPTGPVMTMGPTNIATMGPGINPGIATSPGGFGVLGGGALRREDRVTVIPGVGREEETRLTNAGITNLGAVADADPVVLGTTLGVQPEDAARMIGNVRGALGRPR